MMDGRDGRDERDVATGEPGARVGAPAREGAAHRALLGLLLVLGLVPGCATIVRSTRWPEPQIYGGVREDWGAVADPSRSEDFAIFHLLDLPLSLALDTALLPVNLVLWIFHGGEDEAGGGETAAPPSGSPPHS